MHPEQKALPKDTGLLTSGNPHLNDNMFRMIVEIEGKQFLKQLSAAPNIR